MTARLQQFKEFLRRLDAGEKYSLGYTREEISDERTQRSRLPEEVATEVKGSLSLYFPEGIYKFSSRRPSYSLSAIFNGTLRYLGSRLNPIYAIMTCDSRTPQITRQMCIAEAELRRKEATSRQALSVEALGRMLDEVFEDEEAEESEQPRPTIIDSIRALRRIGKMTPRELVEVQTYIPNCEDYSDMVEYVAKEIMEARKIARLHMQHLASTFPYNQ